MQVTQTQRNSLTDNADGRRSTIIIPDSCLKKNSKNYNGMTYSPLSKYRETEGIKDIGTQFWNQGRTAEIFDRILHL